MTTAVVAAPGRLSLLQQQLGWIDTGAIQVTPQPPVLVFGDPLSLHDGVAVGDANHVPLVATPPSAARPPPLKIPSRQQAPSTARGSVTLGACGSDSTRTSAMEKRCNHVQFGQDTADIGGNSMITTTAAFPTMTSSAVKTGRCHSYDEFVRSRSCVVRVFLVLTFPIMHQLFNLPPSPQFLLAALFSESSIMKGIPKPLSLWAPPNTSSTSVWAVFSSHAEASAALQLSGPSISVQPALPSDLDTVDGLRRVLLPPIPRVLKNPISEPDVMTTSHLFSLTDMYAALPDTDTRPIAATHPSHAGRVGLGLGMTGGYTISSNPPNPKSHFRVGDWICASAACGAHNFGRNSTCIACRLPRGSPSFSQPESHSKQHPAAPRLPASPRFAGPPANFVAGLKPAPITSVPSPLAPYTPSAMHSPTSSVRSAGGPPSPQYPLLTPSGRTFSSGGKVQNVSSNPLAPCVMWWPDNEPFPETGQIRPVASTGLQHPPILNTGNRGPIEHQPGDWICQKCNYLNWRRRKVCQTCFPYAEGNGDSISAAVQAERIALLANALGRQGLDSPLSSPISSFTPAVQQPVSAPLRSYSMTPPQVATRSMSEATLARARSQLNLGAQYALPSPTAAAAHMRPIYQTSGYPSSSSMPGSPIESAETFPPSPTGSGESMFLPACLQDIVASPSLSPTSSYSAELSVEDEVVDGRTFYATGPRFANGSNSSLVGAGGAISASIWGFDGEERKVFHVGRKGSPEMMFPRFGF